MKTRIAIISATTFLFLAVLAWKSWTNPTAWHWIASIALAVLIVHLGYGANQLLTRYPRRALTDSALDFLILFSLLTSILSLPDLVLCTASIAFFYYFIGTRYMRIIKRTKGIKKHYAIQKFKLEMPLAIVFGLASIFSILLPLIISIQVLSALLFGVIVIGSIWLAFFSGVYRLP
ncbi:MAG: hypothetical protein AABX51_04935 [Nanoarchaeota archaeon]